RPRDGLQYAAGSRWRRIAVSAAVVLLLLSGSAAVYMAVRDPPDTFAADDAVLPAAAVLPFRTAGDDTGIWREGIVDLLSYHVEARGGGRRIDPRRVRDAWQDVVEAMPGGEGWVLAREVARRTGARHVITGSAVRDGATVHLSADVYDAETGEVRGAVAAVNGPADSLQVLVDRLTVERGRQIR